MIKARRQNNFVENMYKNYKTKNKTNVFIGYYKNYLSKL